MPAPVSNHPVLVIVLVIVHGVVEWPLLFARLRRGRKVAQKPRDVAKPRVVAISSANAARLRHPNVQQPPFGGGRFIDCIAKTFHVGPLLNPERSAAAADRNVADIIFPPHPCQLPTGNASSPPRDRS